MSESQLELMSKQKVKSESKLVNYKVTLQTCTRCLYLNSVIANTCKFLVFILITYFDVKDTFQLQIEPLFIINKYSMRNFNYHWINRNIYMLLGIRLSQIEFAFIYLPFFSKNIQFKHFMKIRVAYFYFEIKFSRVSSTNIRYTFETVENIYSLPNTEVTLR